MNMKKGGEAHFFPLAPGAKTATSTFAYDEVRSKIWYRQKDRGEEVPAPCSLF
jgi:hypothetical protein